MSLFLRSFFSTRKDQNFLRIRLSVIHSISGADVDPDLPNPFPTKFVIARIPRFQSIQPSHDCGFAPLVQETPKPFLKGNQSIRIHIESDSHDEIVAFKRTKVKSFRNVGFLQEISKGCWPEILIGLGIDPRFLVRRHGPCPACGGQEEARILSVRLVAEGRRIFVVLPMTGCKNVNDALCQKPEYLG